MTASVAMRVQNYRNNLRSSGFRPVQIWVRDTRSKDFEQECKRQMMVVSQSDLQDSDLHEIMDIALNDMSEWQ